MAEWSKALAWKVSIRQNRIEGSNPSRSATFASVDLGEAVTAGAQAAAARGDLFAPGEGDRPGAIPHSYRSAWIGLARATLIAWPTTVAIAIPSAIAAAITKGTGVSAIR